MKQALLDILVCPITRTPLRYNADGQFLISDEACVRYPIKNGIPMLLKEMAEKIE